MKNSAVRFVLGFLVLVLLGTAEEMAPKLLEVGLPLLLVAVQFYAARRSLPEAIVFAVAAGGVEDALSGLPLMTSVSYFLAVTILIRWVEVPRFATFLTFPIYQLWLHLWVPRIEGGVFMRMLVSLPLGAVLAFLLVPVLAGLDGKAAVDDEE